jgi:Dynamin family
VPARRLAEDRFQLAVVGQFSRGKSTLMNAFLGKPYLPMSALPTTSVITTVRYGSTLGPGPPARDLRRWFLTDEEHQAHLRTLAYLAGSANLARPMTPDE